jgi:hypothetical protein
MFGARRLLIVLDVQVTSLILKAILEVSLIHPPPSTLSSAYPPFQSGRFNKFDCHPSFFSSAVLTVIVINIMITHTKKHFATLTVIPDLATTTKIICST